MTMGDVREQDRSGSDTGLRRNLCAAQALGELNLAVPSTGVCWGGAEVAASIGIDHVAIRQQSYPRQRLER